MIVQLLISTFVPLAMGICNVLIELLIQAASALTRPINETKNIIDSITGISWIQYINLGTILIVVTLDFNLDNYFGINNPYGVF